MDYKYIEQLLERYWECQTTLEEEAILHTFFAQTDIPASLLPYRDLFLAEEQIAGERLGTDFDERMMAAIRPTEETQEDGTARTVALQPRKLSDVLRPLWRAAAVVAVVLTIGMAAQQGFQREEASSGQDAQWAMGPASDTLQLFTEQPQASPNSETALTATPKDSIAIIPQ